MCAKNPIMITQVLGLFSIATKKHFRNPKGRKSYLKIDLLRWIEAVDLDAISGLKKWPLNGVY